MAKVKIGITIRKSLLRGAQYAAVAAAAIQTVPVPDAVGVDQKATVVFVIGLIGAIAKGIHNYRKISGRAPYLGSGSGYALALAAAGLLAGCVTTTAPDGTVTQRVDSDALETMWDRYERLQARRDGMQPGLERASVDREIARLAERLGVTAPMY